MCDIAEMCLSELTFLVLKTNETTTLGCTNDADEVSEPLISSVVFEKEPTPQPPSFSLHPLPLPMLSLSKAAPVRLVPHPQLPLHMIRLPTAQGPAFLLTLHVFRHLSA